MSEAMINLFVLGVDWTQDGGGLTICGVRIGGSRTRGLELGLNPGVGIEVNNIGIGSGVRADMGIRDGVSFGAACHAGFGVFHAEAASVFGCDNSSGTWGTAYADAFNALEDPEDRKARLAELQRRVAAAWQAQVESRGGGRAAVASLGPRALLEGQVAELQRHAAAAWQAQVESTGGARAAVASLGPRALLEGRASQHPGLFVEPFPGTQPPAAAAPAPDPGAVLCPDCGKPRGAARFCGATGRSHSAGLCGDCGEPPESTPYCTVTGRQHA